MYGTRLRCISSIGFTWKKRIWARSIRPKFPEIPIQNRMELKFSGNSFRKFRFTSRGCPFFLEIWKIRQFPVPFGISTRYELAPVSLAVKSYMMAASLSSQHYTGWKAICLSLFLIEDEIVTIWFPAKYGDWSLRISWGQFARFAYSPTRKVRKFCSSHKYQGRVEFWMRVKLLYMKQLNTALETATSSRSFSILSSDSWWEMCSSGNRTRSVWPGGKYRSIQHTKISEIQTRNFGRMERALYF